MTVVIHRATRTPSWDMPEGYEIGPMRWVELPDGQVGYLQDGGPGWGWQLTSEDETIREDGFLSLDDVRAWVTSWKENMK